MPAYPSEVTSGDDLHPNRDDGRPRSCTRAPDRAYTTVIGFGPGPTLDEPIPGDDANHVCGDLGRLWAELSGEQGGAGLPTHPPAPGPQVTATLFCGNDRYGYRHIATGHGMDWQNIAFYTGENWRFLADFAIEQILTVPEPGYPRLPEGQRLLDLPCTPRDPRLQRSGSCRLPPDRLRGRSRR